MQSCHVCHQQSACNEEESIYSYWPLQEVNFRCWPKAAIGSAENYAYRIAVYGLLLIASNLLMADMARLHTYIRPLKLAYVDAGP